MVTVSGLYVYPVKSWKGISRQEAQLDETGLRFDRHWVVMEAGHLILSAPGIEALALPIGGDGERMEVRIWDDRCSGLDQGDDAARWLRALLGLRSRGRIAESCRWAFSGCRPTRRETTGIAALKDKAESLDANGLINVDCYGDSGLFGGDQAFTCYGKAIRAR